MAPKGASSSGEGRRLGELEDQHPHAPGRVGQRPGHSAAHRAHHEAGAPKQPRLRGGERKRGRHGGQFNYPQA
jgi:hypothetical protein